MNDAMDKARKEDLKKIVALLKELNIDEKTIIEKVTTTFSITADSLEKNMQIKKNESSFFIAILLLQFL